MSKGRPLLEAVAGPLTTESRGRGLKMARASVCDTVGVRGHLLTTTSVWRRNEKGRQVVDVVCDCGTRKTILASSIGRVKSCGCYQVKHPARLRHGMSRTPIHTRWLAMKYRSTGFHPGYEGVGRDPRWDRFEEFYADMGPTFFDGAYLGRIGDVGDYTKDNARWITPAESGVEATNRFARRMPDGRRVIDAAIELGVVRPRTALARVDAGWDPDDAIRRPPRFSGRWHQK